MYLYIKYTVLRVKIHTYAYYSLKRIMEAPQHLTIHSFMGKSNELYVCVLRYFLLISPFGEKEGHINL